MSSANTSPRDPPFRAEHIGSLLRPDELVRKRYAVAEKSAAAEELVPVEQKSIREIVKLQQVGYDLAVIAFELDADTNTQECGIHSITNGEYSRHQFWGTFFETLKGMVGS